MIVERVGRDELEFEGIIYLRKIVPFSGQAFMSLGLTTLDVSRPTRPMAKSIGLWLPWGDLPVAERGGKRAGSALRSFAKDRALEPPARDYADTLLAALKAGQALPDPPV